MVRGNILHAGKWQLHESIVQLSETMFSFPPRLFIFLKDLFKIEVDHSGKIVQLSETIFQLWENWK